MSDRNILISNLRRIADILETTDDVVIRRNIFSLTQDVREPFLGAFGPSSPLFHPAIPVNLSIEVDASFTNYTLTEDV